MSFNFFLLVKIKDFLQYRLPYNAFLHLRSRSRVSLSRDSLDSYQQWVTYRDSHCLPLYPPARGVPEFLYSCQQLASQVSWSVSALFTDIFSFNLQ